MPRATTIIVILLVVSVGIGAYFGYQYYQTRSEVEALLVQNDALEDALTDAKNLGVVKIGFVASTLTDLELTQPFIEQVVQPDLNEYAAKLGYNVTFQFVFRQAEGDNRVYLDTLKEFKSMGVNLVVSSGWTSQLDAGRNYVKGNDMLLVGTYSTSTPLAIANDHLFRMCPSERDTPAALAAAMWSYGVKDVIIIKRGVDYTDSFTELFSEAWEARGGEIEGDLVAYPGDVETTIDFTPYLQTANSYAEEAKAKYPSEGQVAVLLLEKYADAELVTQIADYPTLYDCILFSGYNHIGEKTDELIANPQASHMKTFIIEQSPLASSKIADLEARYPGSGSGFVAERGAYIYDASWAVAQSVLEVRSADASDVVAVFPDVCSRLHGASGWCKLNKYGDRAPLPFDVWSYANSTYTKPRLLAGVYEPDTDIMSWDSEELGYSPPGP